MGIEHMPYVSNHALSAQHTSEADQPVSSGEGRELDHLIVLNVVLALYLFWDIVARRYYRSRSRKWFEFYGRLSSWDVTLFTVFGLVAYIPFISRQAQISQVVFSVFSPDQTEFFSASLVAAFLMFEVVMYLVVSSHTGTAPEEVLAVDRGYSAIADVYDKCNAIMHVERRHTSTRLSELDIRGRILDIGCGTGYYSERLASGASELFAVDCNDAMLRRCRERLASRTNVHFLKGKASYLEGLADGSFDCVFCCLLIDHLDPIDLSALFHEVFRVLRAGGWLYITDVNPYYELSEQRYARFIDAKGFERRIEVFPHTIGSIAAEMGKAGFRTWQLTEVRVVESDVVNVKELAEILDYPLVVEYLIYK
jgi:ubiquinone/menaquinone biosynthesis C-methylase UbiE